MDEQPKSPFDHIADHPKFAAILALVAFATSFSPRASMMALWICVFLAWVFSSAMIVGLPKLRSSKHRIMLSTLSIVIAAILLFSYGKWLRGSGNPTSGPIPASASAPIFVPAPPAVNPSAAAKPLPTSPASKDNQPSLRPLPDSSSVTLIAYLQLLGGEYPDGVLLGGIPWQKNYYDVRLEIGNGQVAIQNLDLLVGLDASIAGLDMSIAGLGQISQFPGITAFPAKSFPAGWIDGTDPKGKQITLPIIQDPGLVSIAPVWRVHCTNLIPNTVVHLVIASLALNPSGKDGGLPQQLFASRRPPKSIRVQGQYEVSSGGTVNKHTVDLSYNFPAIMTSTD